MSRVGGTLIHRCLSLHAGKAGNAIRISEPRELVKDSPLSRSHTNRRKRHRRQQAGERGLSKPGRIRHRLRQVGKWVLQGLSKPDSHQLLLQVAAPPCRRLPWSGRGAEKGTEPVHCHPLRGRRRLSSLPRGSPTRNPAVPGDTILLKPSLQPGLAPGVQAKDKS